MKILESAEFREAWELWHQHRKEINKKITPTAEKLQLKKLESWGERKAIFAIHTSIENGWQGLFEPKDKDMPMPKLVAVAKVEPLQPVPEMPKLTAAERAANMARIREMIESSRAVKSL